MQVNQEPIWSTYAMYQKPEWSDAEIDQTESLSSGDKSLLKVLAHENEGQKMLAISVLSGNTLYFHDKEHIVHFVESMLQHCKELFGYTVVPT